MTWLPRPIEQLLTDLKTADALGARVIAGDVRNLLKPSPSRVVDRAAFREICDALHSRGIDLGCTWDPVHFAPGESWLLLTCGGRGHVARVRYRSDALPGHVSLVTPELEGARRGLRALLRARRKEPRLDPNPALELITQSWRVSSQVTDRSHGLAGNVAAIAAWTGTVLPCTLAATAAVADDGTLEPVLGLEEKVCALALRWPGVVEKVVVAATQPEVGSVAGIQLFRCTTMEEALSAFGLLDALELLPDLRAAAHWRTRVAGFVDENRQDHDAADWRRLGTEALDAADRLRSEESVPNKAAAVSAAGWAALFFLHAGDSGRAKAIADEVFADEANLRLLDPEPRVTLCIKRASIEIDTDPGAAVVAATRAVKEAEELRANFPTAHAETWARALGTLGRALLHANRRPEALACLEDALAFHRQNLPEETARSTNYYATALRLAGRPEDALAHTEAAFGLLPSRGHATWKFLRLEQGRCLQALQRYDEARAAFDDVAYTGSDDSDYPRIGALRGLAAAGRALGDSTTESDALTRCLQVAETQDGLIGKLAAAAAGDAMVVTANSDPRVVRAWQRHFGKQSPGEILATIVY